MPDNTVEEILPFLVSFGSPFLFVLLYQNCALGHTGKLPADLDSLENSTW